MTRAVVGERMKGFVSVSAHPAGCARQVTDMIDRVRRPTRETAPGPVVVVGASGGYGLPAAAIAAFGLGAPVVGIGYDRPPEGQRTATAGWYNTVELHRHATANGATMVSFNGDGFADDTKTTVIDALHTLGPPSLLLYSLAAPVRTDPVTGVTYRSTLKPIGEPFTTKTVRIDTGEVRQVTLEAATGDEIEATTKVMGGEDWERWINFLDRAELIRPRFRTVAFDYVGPSVTHPIYRSGTIGRAKTHLESTADQLHERLATNGGGAWTSVNAAAVTQSSAAIPAVPLYLSLLLAVTEPAGVFEDPTTQMLRLFDDHLGPDGPTRLDEHRRIRLDDWELIQDVQDEITTRWQRVETSNLGEVADFPGFHKRFRQLFGFAVPDIDYDLPVELDASWPNK